MQAPDVTQATGLFLATVFGSGIGVVAGTAIQYVLSLALENRSKRRQKDALVKELFYNKSLVNEVSEEIRKLRNSVNGGALSRYFGFFPYSNAIFAQANASANNGILYEFLSIDNIRHAQRLVLMLSVNHANWVNAEVASRKAAFISTPEQFDKAEAVSFVDFLESEVRDLDRRIDEILKELQGRRTT